MYTPQISRSAPSLVASVHQKHSHSEGSVQSSPLHIAESMSHDTISATQLGYRTNLKQHHIKQHGPTRWNRAWRSNNEDYWRKCELPESGVQSTPHGWPFPKYRLKNILPLDIFWYLVAGAIRRNSRNLGHWREFPFFADFGKGIENSSIQAHVPASCLAELTTYTGLLIHMGLLLVHV